MRYTNDQIWKQALGFAADASVLIHSAPYTRSEHVQDYGHSRVEDALDLAVEANVGRLFLYHHAPTRTDDQLDALVAHYRASLASNRRPLELHAAREGDLITV